MLLNETVLQDRYRIIEHIGRGGMGSVYKAEDLRLHAIIALKQTLIDDAYLSEAFSREAQLVASLRHPAIPHVSDHFVDEQGQFLVMEFIPGHDLGKLMEQQRRPFELPDVIRWADQLLAALEYLHGHQPPIIHRDIKPQNLKLTATNDIILLDFGLAKGAPLHNQLVASPSIFGYTPHYAPLEQIHGTGTDARSDLYALAATLYHLVTGNTPIDAASRAAAIIEGLPDPLLPAHQINRAVPVAISSLIHHAMAQRASQRPASASVMRAALQQAQREEMHEFVFVEPMPTVEHFATIGRSTIPLARPTVLPPERRGMLQRFHPLALIAAVVLAGTLGVAAFQLVGTGNRQAQTGVQSGGVDVPASSTALPAQMSGSLNIAVAAFTPTTDEPCTVSENDALGLSNVVYTTLSEQMRTVISQLKPNQTQGISLDDIQFRSPEQTGVVVEGTDTNPNTPQQRAKALNADVLLYGRVSCSSAPRQTLVEPVLYVSDRKSQSFEQLQFLGAHPFGSGITSDGTPESSAVRSQLATALIPNTTMLAQFLYGIDFYYAGKYQAASDIFQSASSVQQADSTFLRFIVLLFQGTAASRLDKPQDAEQYYNQALAIEPSNINAQYSVADALFYASRGDCSSGAQSPDGLKEDADGLRESLQRYQQIAVSGTTTLDTMLRGVIALGTAQVYVCLSEANIPDAVGQSDHWENAKQQYGEAIEAFQKSNTFGKDQLAEAHAGLGLTLLKAPSPQDEAAKTANLLRAGKEFCAATQVSGFSYRQAEFHHLLAFVHGQLGEYEQADAEYKRALKSDPASADQYETMHQGWSDAWAKAGTSNTPSWTCNASDTPQ